MTQQPYTLTQAQQKTVTHDGHIAVLGGAGTGKTVALVERVAHLIETENVAPEDIYVSCFTYYAWNRLRDLLIQRLGADVGVRIHVGTLRRFAQKVIEHKDGTAMDIATSRIMRRSLRQAVAESGFDGNMMEAEHVVRTFKSRARKPKETEPHYLLFANYKRYVEVDRHDVLRHHLIGMRQMSYAALSARHILIDDIQDINRIQLLWLNEQVKHGTTVSVYGNDDTCVFMRDGALGAELFTDIKDIDGLKPFKLTENFRFDAKFHNAVEQALDPTMDRLPKNMTFKHKEAQPCTLQAVEYASVEEELAMLVQKVKAVPAHQRIGIITRTDWQAVRIHRLLEKEGIAHSSFGHNIWDVPGAIAIMDLLRLMLGKAENKHLRNVLLVHGLESSLVDQLFAAGLDAHGWLQQGAPMPTMQEVDPVILQKCTAFTSQLVTYFKLMVKKVERPKTIFKAAAYLLMEHMDEDDKANALIALDTLLTLHGPLVEMLEKVIAAQSADWNDRIVVGPARTMREQEFDWVFIPQAGNASYPFAGHKVLGQDSHHESRLLYMALSRTKQELIISHTLPLGDGLSRVIKAANAG